MLSTFLTVLKFAGVLLAAFSSIWGTLHNVTVDDPSGQKHLTKQGRWAIAAIILGFLISISTSFVEDVVADKKSKEERQKEAERTREIIISGQSLVSLRLQWEFNHVPELFLKYFKKEETTVLDLPNSYEEQFKYLYGVHAADMFSSARRYHQLYPWLRSLAGRPWSYEGGVVCLVGLDRDASSIIPFGAVAKTKGDLAGGIRSTKEFPNALIEQDNSDPPVESDASQANLRIRSSFQPELRVKDQNLIIDWKLDPVSLAQAIDRVNPTTTVGSPERIRILVLSKIRDLPISGTNNFSQPDWPLPWVEQIQRSRNFLGDSTLTLYPNGFEDYPMVFEMRFLGKQKIADEGHETKHFYSDVSVWEGIRIRKQAKGTKGD